MLCAATLACTSAVCPRRSSRALPTLITSPTAKTPSRPSTCHMGPCHPQHYKCSRHVCKQGSGRETDLQAGINTNGAVGRKHESIAARQTRPTRPFRARLFSDLMPKSVRARRPAHTREDKVGVYSAAHEIWQPTHGKAPAVCFKSVSPSCHSDIAMLPRCAHCRCTNGHVVGSPFPAFGHVRGVAYGGGEVHVQHSTTSNILQPMCAEHLSSVHADALSGAAAPSCEACVAKCLSARAHPTCPWYRTLQRTQKGRERENRSPSGCSAPRTRTEDGEEEPSGAGASTPAASESWMISQRCPRSTSTLTAQPKRRIRPGPHLTTCRIQRQRETGHEEKPCGARRACGRQRDPRSWARASAPRPIMRISSLSLHFFTTPSSLAVLLLGGRPAFAPSPLSLFLSPLPLPLCPCLEDREPDQNGRERP